MRSLKKAQVGEEIRMKDLTEEEVTRIRNIIDKEYEVEGDLRRNVTMNIKRLMDISAYRGLCAIVEGYRSMAKELIQMREQEKALRKQWVLVLKNKDLEKLNLMDKKSKGGKKKQKTVSGGWCRPYSSHF